MAGPRANEIASRFEREIREGRLAPGAALPPVRVLAEQAGVSPGTAAAAYRTLRQRGLAGGRGRLGTRVSARPALAVRPPDVVPAARRDLATGNPDAALLPKLPALRVQPSALDGASSHLPDLLRLARRHLAADGVPTGQVTLMGGALDAIERVLQAHLGAGDRVAVEDPGYPGVLDLVAALGLVPEPVTLDESGVHPDALDRALRAGARACVLTPRAQNPTGAAFDERRARALRQVLDAHPKALVLEDDHAGPVAGAPALTLSHEGRQRWAVVRSVSKWLGPDLRLAILAGDAVTVARVHGRQALGAGWVSHVLQSLVLRLWSDPATSRRLATASATYARRRQALIDALARRGIPAYGRSGLNVWVPVAEEAATVTQLAVAGWAVRAGERYRLKSAPALRVTVSALTEAEAVRFAGDLARLLRPARAVHTA
jgi:DNA-binding transcriptional MocR family regulator